MKIGIDISQSTFKGTGVGRYTTHLVYALIEGVRKKNRNDITFVFFFSSLRRKVDEDLKRKILQYNHVLKEFPFPPVFLDFIWNKMHVVPIERLIGDVDVFISSDWTQPPVKKARSVTIVHDLIPYVYPQTQTKKIVETHKRRLGWVQKECNQIITDSQSSSEDIHKILKIPERKIDVLYPYVQPRDLSESAKTSIRSQYTLFKPYILSVGKLEPRKNIATLLMAFKEAQLKNVELVIVGEKGWGEETPSKTLNSKNMPNVRFLGFVPDEQLSALYANAEFFIFPSLYEGFGYPIVEAMQFGCPIACSNTSSMKEIAVDHAVLFDPLNQEDITDTLVTLHNNEKLLKNLSIKSKKRGEFFSEERYVQSLLDILRI